MCRFVPFKQPASQTFNVIMHKLQTIIYLHLAMRLSFCFALRNLRNLTARPKTLFCQDIMMNLFHVVPALSVDWFRSLKVVGIAHWRCQEAVLVFCFEFSAASECSQAVEKAFSLRWLRQRRKRVRMCYTSTHSHRWFWSCSSHT